MSDENSLSAVMETVAKDLPEEKVDHLPTEAAAEPAQETPAWEAPGYTKRWKEPSRKALEALYANAEAKTHLDPLLKELDETYGYIGRRDNEYAQYRKQLDPIAEVIAPYVQQYQLQGMTPQQGLQQLFATADSIRQNPDQTFPWLAQMYKPRDAGQVIQALAQAWGADLGQLTQDAPYIDPNMQQMFGALSQRLQTYEQAMWQQQQGQMHAKQAAVLREIEAFESAADAAGTPKNPHFREVYDDMVSLLNMQRARTLPEAYEMAVRLNPQLAQAMAEKKALAEAARQTADAKQAAEASRNVSGKPTGKDKRPSSIEEAMRAADKSMAA